MRLNRLPVPALLLIAGLCAGCGSTSYQSSAQAAVHDMSSAIQSYNSAAQHDVQSTGRACSQAYDSIKAHTPPPPPPAGKQFHAEGKLLNATYRLALKGLSHCASGAASGSYPLLQQGVAEIGIANRDVSRLKRMERHAVVR